MPKASEKTEYTKEQASWDLDTLTKAEEIKADSKKMELIGKLAKKKKKAISSIADLRALQSEMQDEDEMEEDEEEDDEDELPCKCGKPGCVCDECPDCQPPTPQERMKKTPKLNEDETPLEKKERLFYNEGKKAE
jgi:hypothetical protein